MGGVLIVVSISVAHTALDGPSQSLHVAGGHIDTGLRRHRLHR
jgi:hypothetical protein